MNLYSSYNYNDIKANNVYPYNGVNVVQNNITIPIYRLKVNGVDYIHKNNSYMLYGTIKLSIRYTFECTSTSSGGGSGKCPGPTYYYYTMHLKKIEMCINSSTGDVSSMTVKLTNYSQKITQDYGSGSKFLTTLSFTSSTQLSSSYKTVWSGDVDTQEGGADFNTSITVAVPTLSLNFYWSSGSYVINYTYSSITTSISAVTATSSSTSAKTESSSHEINLRSNVVQEY